MNYEKRSNSNGFRGGGQSSLSSLRGIGAGQAPFRAAQSNNRKIGFTLAEVLITLGIIGIVAAMTMPTLIAKHQKTVLVSRLKKVYSITANAVMLSESENGFISEWDLGTDYTRENLKRVVDKYLRPYFKIVDTVESKDDTGSYSTYGFRLADGTTLLFSLDGASSGGYAPASIMILADFKGRTAINSAKDLDYSRNNFEMAINKNVGKLSFFAWGEEAGSYAKNYTREDIINHSKYGCNSKVHKSGRMNCGALIQYDGWQIKDDYPW